MAALTVILPNNTSNTNSANHTSALGHQKNTAPKMKAGKSPDSAVSSSTTKTSSKRKIAFHPTLGYAIPPPQPAKVARRNARERNRVKQVNCGFEMLRTHIPSAAKHKKMSKVDTLRHAVEYIQNLQTMLGEQENIVTPKIEPASSPSPSATSSTSSSSLSAPPSGSSSTTTNQSSNSSVHQAPPPLTLMTNQGPGGYTPPDQLNTSYPSPLTPRTPNTPNGSVNGDQYTQLQPLAGGQHFGSNESGYETSSYYSSGLMSPHQYSASPHPQQQHHNHHHHQQQQQQHHQMQHPGYGYQQHIPTAYYENSEEDELLDAIAKWQDQED